MTSWENLLGSGSSHFSANSFTEWIRVAVTIGYSHTSICLLQPNRIYHRASIRKHSLYHWTVTSPLNVLTKHTPRQMQRSRDDCLLHSPLVRGAAWFGGGMIWSGGEISIQSFPLSTWIPWSGRGISMPSFPLSIWVPWSGSGISMPSF